MNNEQIKERLLNQFPNLMDWEQPYGLLTFKVSAEEIMKVLDYLYKSEGFQFLTDITAVHYPERTGEELCVVYHVHNLVENIRLRMKVYVPIEKPDVPTATKLFAGANWMERETFDFFGINFIDHPNLIRILNVEDMDYFPMRKEYPMEDPTRIDKDDDMFGRG